MDGACGYKKAEKRNHHDKEKEHVEEWLMIDHRIAPEKDPKNEDKREGKQ